jgi:hypothetical protein
VAESTAKINSLRRSMLSAIVLLLAWLVPGLGHVLLRRWMRGLVFFTVVSGLALCGVLLRGHIFTLPARDFFEWLGCAANLGAGAFYFVAQLPWRETADVSRAAGDYGTRFFATAGVLNILCVLDAQDILHGRKT